MRDIIRIFKLVLPALALTLLLASCERKDDINAIFRGSTWYLTYVKDGDKERYTPKKYSINFVNNNFEARMPNGSTIKGTWYADGGESHTFSCSNIRITDSFTGDTIAEKMYGILKNAKKYNGTTTWLQIIQDKNTYMQFYNYYGRE